MTAPAARIPLLALGLLLWTVPQDPSDNLVPNGGFEEVRGDAPADWSGLWTRERGAGRLAPDADVRHGGKRSVRIEHTGSKDWSFGSGTKVDVRTGDLFTLETWARLRGEGRAEICVITRDRKGSVRNWVYAGRATGETKEWLRLRSRFAIPEGVASIEPRVIGTGPATAWIDDFSLVRTGNVADRRRKDLPARLEIENDALAVALRTADATLAVRDKRTGRTWRQVPLQPDGLVVEAESSDAIEMTWLHAPTGMEVRARIALDKERPELTFSLSAKGEVEGSVAFPHPFRSDPGSFVILPLNEGISYPVEERVPHSWPLIAYGGHGICMAFWGVTDGERGHMAIIETADDCSVRLDRVEDRLVVSPLWDPQKGRFGYERRLRYVFFDRGGHVAMCKRYRTHAKEQGRFRTLAEKRKENPNVDLLVGAVNVWCWERDPLPIVRELRSLGIERILWSRRGSPESIRAMNEMKGVLTSRYDIYQDLMDPEVVREQMRGPHPDWTQKGWPDDLMIDEQGRWRRGWQVKGKDGKWYPCGVLCDRQALRFARERIPKDLEDRPYRSRFIDTTTASPWRECHDPDHPMTRSDSRHWKTELLRYVSGRMRLVTGSETGHDAAVHCVHYFEGMMSLGPYRVPDAGRDMMKILDEVPERVAKYQVGHRYRLPLWELVYHDCVVAMWYWGDYNNKLPSLWDKRDLFNLLYGTPPMFMFNRRIWKENRDRFVRSYRNICPTVRRVGYLEMTDHRFLTENRDVQQTVFSDGTTITVNFGDRPYRLGDRKEIPPNGFDVSPGDK